MNWVFISDLHLDSEKIGSLDFFENFLERELNNEQKLLGLYILGDLCEVWVGDDDDSTLITRLRVALKKVSEQAPVYFLPGNRDFLLGSEFAQSCGLQILEDPVCIEIADTKILLSHGDAFCTNDLEYQKMRQVFRSPEFQMDILSKSLEERRGIAEALRKASIHSNANKADNIMDVTTAEVRTSLITHQVSHLIHGHTHRPGIHLEIIEEQLAYRYVLGDWARCGWLLRFDGENFRMECFATGNAR